MTESKPPVLTPQPLIRRVLDLLVGAKPYTRLHHEAVALIHDLTDALEHAESPASAGHLYAELVESVALTTKVELPTEPTLHSLRRAREALAGVSVDAQVIALPRATTPDAQRDIAAEVSRQLEQAQGVDLVFYVDGTRIDQQRRPSCPRAGECIIVRGDRRRVLDLLHDDEFTVVFLSTEVFSMSKRPL